MYCITILGLKDWFIIIAGVIFLIWLTGGYLWYKIKSLITKDSEDQ